jgi:hypothetical protein
VGGRGDRLHFFDNAHEADDELVPVSDFVLAA